MKNIIEQLTQAGFTKIESDQFKNIACINKHGETVGLTVLPKLHHNDKELLSIKWKNVSIYDKWYCLCSYDGYMKVIDVIGKEFCILKGAEFSKFCMDSE